ncbi:MAG: hypothetical protein NTZ13_02025 [Candidatus Parcubacteria bacterium]|nr:hypothetical protein [Candidatus Parcubacteria bacterium]
MSEYHEFEKKALENLFIAIGYGIIAFFKKKQEEKALESKPDPKIQAKQKPQTRQVPVPPKPISELKGGEETFDSMP